MALDCILTVKGNGVGRYGHPKKDRTGPITDFLVDNTVFYSAVTKHLTICKRCSIQEVLTAYLDRRVQKPKFEGKTSGSLVRRAIVLANLAKKRKASQFIMPFSASLYGVSAYTAFWSMANVSR